MKTNKVNDLVGTFVVKLCDVEAEIYFYKQLPLNDSKNNFYENLNDSN